MTNFFYPVCFILFIWSNYFPHYSAEPIQGGQRDQGNEAIWQVSYQKIGYDGTWKHACGGSIVNLKYIITAAHCFVRFGAGETQIWDRWKRARIVIGTNDLNSSGVEMKMDKVMIPKGYTRLEDKTLVNDIAVIKLKDRIDLSINGTKYGRIGLFYPKDEAGKTKYDNEEGYVSGFGAVEVKVGLNGKRTFVFDRLRNILPVQLTDYKCPKVHGLRCVRYVKSAEGPKGICCGDSGGPLYYRNGNEFELVGVVSHGPADCDIRQSNQKVGKIMFIPDYKDFLDKVEILDTKMTFPKMSAEEFEKAGVDYIVLPDQVALAREYYVKPTEKKAEKKPCRLK